MCAHTLCDCVNAITCCLKLQFPCKAICLLTLVQLCINHFGSYWYHFGSSANSWLVSFWFNRHFQHYLDRVAWRCGRTFRTTHTHTNGHHHTQRFHTCQSFHMVDCIAKPDATHCKCPMYTKLRLPMQLRNHPRSHPGLRPPGRPVQGGRRPFWSCS